MASADLRELCGLSVSDNTIRDVCQAEGVKRAEWQRRSSVVREEFVAAEGDLEFTTDGTLVNTAEGWQEMKLALFAKRPRGESATPAEGDGRSVPKPSVRVGFAAIEGSERFGARW